MNSLQLDLKSVRLQEVSARFIRELVPNKVTWSAEVVDDFRVVCCSLLIVMSLSFKMTQGARVGDNCPIFAEVQYNHQS